MVIPKKKKKKIEFHLPSLKNIVLLYDISQKSHLVTTYPIVATISINKVIAKSINFWSKNDPVSSHMVPYLTCWVESYASLCPSEK